MTKIADTAVLFRLVSSSKFKISKTGYITNESVNSLIVAF